GRRDTGDARRETRYGRRDRRRGCGDAAFPSRAGENAAPSFSRARENRVHFTRGRVKEGDRAYRPDGPYRIVKVPRWSSSSVRRPFLSRSRYTSTSIFVPGWSWETIWARFSGEM